MTANITTDNDLHWRVNVETQVGDEARKVVEHFQNIAAGISQLAQDSDAAMMYRTKLIRAINGIRNVVEIAS